MILKRIFRAILECRARLSALLAGGEDEEVVEDLEGFADVLQELVAGEALCVRDGLVEHWGKCGGGEVTPGRVEAGSF